MSTKTMKYAALVAGALGIAGAVAITMANPSRAAPVTSIAAAIKAEASTQVTEVYYRRHYYGRRYYRRGYAYPYRGYGYPYGGYAYPYYPYGYSYPYARPYLGFGFGWGGW
jgi:hypothetical protein